MPASTQPFRPGSDLKIRPEGPAWPSANLYMKVTSEFFKTSDKWRTTRVNALVLQSSFGVTSFVSEVVFLKMPSRQEKRTSETTCDIPSMKFETMF